METNAKGCIIKIKIGDEVKEFKSDRELDGYLYDHRETLSLMLDGKIDKTFSIVEDPFTKAVAVFDAAKIESGNIHSITRNSASVDTKEKIGTMATTRFVHNAGMPDDWSKPIINWDEEKKKTVEYLKRKGLTEKAAELQAAIESETTNVKSSNKTESDAAKFGTDVHSIFEKIIKGKSEAECKSGFKLIHTFGEEFVNELYKQATELINAVKARHPGAQLYAEEQFYSKSMHPDLQKVLATINNTKSVNGKFDLIVIDKEGYVHIYDWKTSVYGFDEWSDNKLRDVKGQLGIYAAILEQYGLKVKSLNVGVLKTSSKKREDGKTIYTATESDGIHSLDLSSRLILNAKRMFPSSTTINTEAINNVNQKVEGLYSGKGVSETRVLTATIEEYKENRVEKFKPGSKEYDSGLRYRFYKDRILSDTGLDREVTARTEEELEKKLESYIQELNEARAAETTSFAYDLDRCLRNRDTEELEKVAKNISSKYKKSIYNRFIKYVSQGWMLDKNEVLLANGFLVFSKGTRSEIVLLDNAALNAEIELLKGTTILGNKLSDREADDQFVLKSRFGNLLLMKAMVFVSEHQDYFEANPISNITVCSLHGREAASSIPPVLIDNYEKLRIHYPELNLKYIGESIFQDSIQLGLDRAYDFLQMSEDGVKKNLKLSEIRTAKEHSLAELREVIEDFVKRYNVDRFSEMEGTNPILLAYNELLQTYAYLMGNWHMESEKDRGMYLNGGINLDGLMFTPFALANSANVRKFDTVMNAFSAKIATEFETKVAVKWQQHMKKLTEKWGAGIAGGEWRFFKNWFVQDSEGNIDPSFRLKNPETHSYFQGDDMKDEREACKFFLEMINMYRTEEQQREEYFNVPLIRAGVLEMLANGENKKTIIKELFKDWSDPIRDALLGAMDSQNGHLKNEDKNELWNPMLSWDSNDREDALQKGVAHFETNLDVVFLATMAWSIKCEAAKEFLPVFNMFRVAMLIENKNNNAKMDEIFKVVTKYVQANIFNHNIIQDSLQGAHKLLSAAKSFVGKVALGLSFRSFVRENISSALNVVVNKTMANNKTIFGDFDKGSYIDAMVTMAVELAEGKGSIDDKIHQLNAIYRISDFGFTQMSDTSRSNRYGFMNLGEDDLYLTSSLPDFYHRNAMLVMKLKTIGAWDAYYMDDNGFVQYDWKKDKRYEMLLKYEKEIDVKPEDRVAYYKAKDLFETSIADWKTLGGDYQNITEPPQALSPMEQKTLKAQSDILFGNYEPEAKALVTKTFLGSLFFQFKTYGYARLLTWIKTGSATNVFQRDYVERINEKTGHLEKTVSITSEDGSDRVYKHESEVTEEEWKSGRARYVMETKGGWMEGKIQSIYALVGCLYNKDFVGFKEKLKDPVINYNIKMALWDTVIMSMIAALIAKIFGEETISNMSEEDWFTQWSYNVLVGVAQDGPVWEVAKSMYSQGTLPLLTSLKRYMDTSFAVLTGSTDFLPAVLSTFGATKELSHYFDHG